MALFLSHRQKAQENSELEALPASVCPPAFSLFRGLPLPTLADPIPTEEPKKAPSPCWFLVDAPHKKNLDKMCVGKAWGWGAIDGDSSLKTSSLPHFFIGCCPSRARLFSKVFMEHPPC